MALHSRTPGSRLGWAAGCLFRIREQLIEARERRDWLAFHAAQDAAKKLSNKYYAVLEHYRRHG